MSIKYIALAPALRSAEQGHAVELPQKNYKNLFFK
jgi:hypothetical protein